VTRELLRAPKARSFIYEPKAIARREREKERNTRAGHVNDMLCRQCDKLPCDIFGSMQGG
jgi:hypothetical protein